MPRIGKKSTLLLSEFCPKKCYSEKIEADIVVAIEEESVGAKEAKNMKADLRIEEKIFSEG